jgi:integrase/recombinase XerD
MLNLWRRHVRKCRHSSRRSKSCSCPIWVEGSLHEAKVRKSLDLRNWDAAQKVVRDWEASGNASLSVEDAFQRFIADCEARNLGTETVAKYRLLQREMTAVFGRRPVDSLSVEDLSRYRESWNMGPLSARKKVERLRTFFRFCVERSWAGKNPASLLKPPRAVQAPTLPFSDDELLKLRESVDAYPDRPAGRQEQLRAFVLLLEHSGLRIRDAVCVSKDKIRDGRLSLYTQKTGQPVWMPLPAPVLEALAPLPARPFWSGECEPKSAVGDWQRTLARLFKIAGILGGHAHRFRDTFAVRLLSRGVSLENVSVLLGHADIKITQKHYAPWVRSRQEMLETEIRKAWVV